MEVRGERRMLDDQFERRSWYEGRRVLESRWAGPMSHDGNQQAENSHQPRLGVVHLLGESLRGAVPPGGDQGFTNGTLLGGPQPNIRGTTATPTALDRREDRGLGSDEQLLLLRGELDHAPPAAGIAERRENPARHAKVRVTHVSGFRGLWQTQGDASELTGGHASHKLRARAATFKSFTAASLDAPLPPRYFSVPVSNACSDKGKPELGCSISIAEGSMRIGIPLFASATVGAFLAGSLSSALSTQAQQPQRPSVYVVNFMKANPAKVQEYLKLEQETWKPVHQERIRAGQMRSWALYNVQYPYGTSLEYDFVTIDTYASLADAERDISAIFAKVHPSAPLSDIGSRTEATRSLVRGEVWSRIDSAP